MIKVKVTSKEQCRDIQLYLFSNGYKWTSGSKSLQYLDNIEKDCHSLIINRTEKTFARATSEHSFLLFGHKEMFWNGSEFINYKPFRPFWVKIEDEDIQSILEHFYKNNLSSKCKIDLRKAKFITVDEHGQIYATSGTNFDRYKYPELVLKKTIVLEHSFKDIDAFEKFWYPNMDNFPTVSEDIARKIFEAGKSQQLP